MPPIFLRAKISWPAYAQRCRQAYKDVALVIGGIEASLRRVAHFDYWSETVRRSILLDSKADILLYGNAERAVIELAWRLANGEQIGEITDLRGSVVTADNLRFSIDECQVIDERQLPDAEWQPVKRTRQSAIENRQSTFIRLPDYDHLKADEALYAHASRIVHLESNPHNARTLLQQHGTRQIRVNPPPIPLSTEEMDTVYELPYTRQPHPAYDGAKIPAYEMIRFSVTIMRGCFGGCSFCSITEHEGRIIQNRSEASILREIENVRDHTPGFTGIISDIGGPTANMYRLHCQDPQIEAACRRLSCVYPGICQNLQTDHAPLVNLYRNARQIEGVKKVLIGSGVRYDLAVESPEYIKELAAHHTGGYLKIAPEHTEAGPLEKMMKPGIDSYYRFKKLFDKYSQAAGKEQYLIPYFIAAHPGTTDEDMLNLALWLKQNNFRPDQVQAFLPSPMALATTMYHSRYNPLKKVIRDGDKMPVPSGLKQRRLHKALLRWHDPNNWPLLRETLKKMGRADLIGNGKKHLVPTWQPAGSGQQAEGARYKPKTKKAPLTTLNKSVTRRKKSHKPGSPVGRGKRK